MSATNASSFEKYALPYSGFRIPTGKNFSLLQNVQTGSGTHQNPYPVGTGVSSPAVNRQSTCLHLDSKLRKSETLLPPVHKFTVGGKTTYLLYIMVQLMHLFVIKH
jgi:hypothetical protein